MCPNRGGCQYCRLQIELWTRCKYTPNWLQCITWAYSNNSSYKHFLHLEKSCSFYINLLLLIAILTIKNFSWGSKLTVLHNTTQLLVWVPQQGGEGPWVVASSIAQLIAGWELLELDDCVIKRRWWVGHDAVRRVHCMHWRRVHCMHWRRMHCMHWRRMHGWVARAHMRGGASVWQHWGCRGVHRAVGRGSMHWGGQFWGERLCPCTLMIETINSGYFDWMIHHNFTGHFDFAGYRDLSVLLTWNLTR